MTTFRRLWFFITRRRRLRDLDDEMSLHVDLLAESIGRRGLPVDDPVLEAKRRFGSPLLLRDESRDVWGFSVIDRAATDLRYAIRYLLSSPGWTMGILLTLALGVGATTSIFSLVDAMLFRPARWSAGGRFVWVSSFQSASGRAGSVSYPDYIAYRDRATTLSGMLAYGDSAVAVGGARPQRVAGGLVSGNYFDVLGVRASVGRTFSPEEDKVPGAHPVLVLSDALWREHFGADPAVVNRTVPINGRPFTIIGIAPRGFTGVADASNVEQLWLPLAMQPIVMPTNPGLLTAADAVWLRVAGRLQEWATVAQADAEVRMLANQLNLAATPPGREKSARVNVMQGGLTPWEQRDVGPIFGLIAIVPTLVLLVACANVANVLMARNVSRRKEFAMRRAIGASRGRLVSLLLTESLLLALTSGAAGVGVSLLLTALIARIGAIPTGVSSLLAPDIRALLAAGAVAMMTIVVFGLAPALMTTGFDMLPALKDEGTTSTGSRHGARFRQVFVVGQIAVSLALLVAAGLFLQSLSKAVAVDPGFDSHGVVTVSFDPALQDYTAARREAFVSQLVANVSSLSSVASVAVTSGVPLADQAYGAEVIAESTERPVQARFASVSSHYFVTMRVPLMRGRDFCSVDGVDRRPVVIVNEALARRLWPTGDPIGKRIRLARDAESWREVIGVVGNVKYTSLTESAIAGFYLPLGQRADSPLSLVVRTTRESGQVLSLVSDIARNLDPDLPLFRPQTLDDAMRYAVRFQRASASLFGVFAGITLLLAAMGVYGIVARSVSIRIREVGIRMSLGARTADVLRMFVFESLALGLIGVVFGLAISAAASRLMTAFLFGLTPTDAMTFIVGSAILCLVTVIGSYVPARRASRVDPLLALRYE